MTRTQEKTLAMSGHWPRGVLTRTNWSFRTESRRSGLWRVR